MQTVGINLLDPLVVLLMTELVPDSNAHWHIAAPFLLFIYTIANRHPPASVRRYHSHILSSVTDGNRRFWYTGQFKINVTGFLDAHILKGDIFSGNLHCPGLSGRKQAMHSRPLETAGHIQRDPPPFDLTTLGTNSIFPLQRNRSDCII